MQLERELCWARIAALSTRGIALSANCHTQKKSQSEKGLHLARKFTHNAESAFSLSKMSSLSKIYRLSICSSAWKTRFHTSPSKKFVQIILETPPPPPTTTGGHHEQQLLTVEPPHGDERFNQSRILRIHLKDLVVNKLSILSFVDS